MKSTRILLQNDTILHIGIDDTDSPKGMCTTFLSYKIVKFLEKQEIQFMDFPSLIRFNPNIPWKTRGNGAVRLTIKTKNPKKIKLHNLWQVILIQKMVPILDLYFTKTKKFLYHFINLAS